MADITYTDNGLFTSFHAETRAGHDAWAGLAEVTGGTGKVLSIQRNQAIQALRATGYTVRKAKVENISDADLLAALAA